MTVLEFWGCALIAFGPPLVMFSMTVAQDPIKVILLISSSFFWLLSFLLVAIFWAVISQFCDYIVIGVCLAVVSQETFRFLFHQATKRAQFHLTKLLGLDNSKQSSSRTQEIHLSHEGDLEFKDRIPLSYVSGLGFGIINGAFASMNVLTDFLGPGTVGLKGDSNYFLLVSAFTTLAFILLNVAWSILMSESIEKSDIRPAALVVLSHFAATLVTFLNREHFQLVSLLVVYSITIFCGLGAFRVAGIKPNDLVRLQNVDTRVR